MSLPPEVVARRAARQKKRLQDFQDSLPLIYRHFNIDRAPNPGLSEHLLTHWRQEGAFDEEGNVRPGMLGWDGPEGLLLFGQPRGGKTQIACELIRRQIAVDDDLADARFIAAVEWGAETSRRAKDCELDGWAHKQLAFAWKVECDPGYLIIDDLDKIRCSPSVESQLFNLIELATSNGVILVVTTNATASDLVKKFSDKAIGKAIVSRLQEFCLPVNMDVQMARIQPDNVVPIATAS